MSRQTTKSILSRDEISLLQHSEEPKNSALYGNLYDVLCSLDQLKAISIDELIDLYKSDKKGVAALTYNKETLLDSVKQEWYTESVSEEDPDKKVRCGLCNTPNKYLFYIKNRKNNQRLNVGSTCMTKFPGIEGYTEYKYQLKKMQHNHKIIARRTIFHQKFPNALDIIESANFYFDNLPILLPADTYNGLKDVVVRLRLIYTYYIEKNKTPFKTPFTPFELFQKAIDQYNKLKIIADGFIEKNINNPLICRREEINWLIKTNRESLIMKIAENNGLYTKDTLAFIYSSQFVFKHFDLFNQRNKSQLLNIKFDRSNNTINCILDKIGYTHSIQYIIDLKSFMKEIGCKCIIDKHYFYNSKDLLNIANISNSINNLESIIWYNANVMNELNYIFLIDYQTHELYLYRKGDGAVKFFSPKYFLKSYSSYILKSDDAIKDFLKKVINGNKAKKWITKDIQEKNDFANKIYRMYKEQYNENIYAKKHSGNKNYYEIPLYNLEQRIDYDNIEYINIKKHDINIPINQHQLIDYAIKVSPTSNMPKCIKDKILLVHATNRLKNQDIGIFCINDIHVVMRYIHNDSNKEKYLETLDNKNSTIILTNDIKICGKVLYILSTNK